MLEKRQPHPALLPFIRLLWVAEGAGSAVSERERVLPTGTMHIGLRLSPQPFRFFTGVDDVTGQTLGHAVVGGARSASYVRALSGPVRSVGAQLQPGAGELLFGVPADELAGRHTALDALWGLWVAETRERLLAAGSPRQQLALFEKLLTARLAGMHAAGGRFRRICGLHPAVAHALGRFATTSDVREVVRQTGYSHRRFIAVFRRAVGLPPKLYCRVLRFQRVLEQIARDPAAPWVEQALDADYSDQAHFNREFREFTGLTPGEYRQRSPRQPNHVPILTACA